MEISGNPRIEELKKRVEKDPTSIAFAQLAEEYRRTGEYQQAVDVCRDGLSRHPGYVSARVTLARALMELDQHAEARHELQGVLRVAPDNLAAIRALADIHQKTGDADETYAMDMPTYTPDPPPVMSIETTRVADEAQPLDDGQPLDDVLGSFSLDLPPLPDMNWDLDVAPQTDASSPAESSGPSAPHESADPALGELAGWLDAILADRAQSR